MDTFGIIFEDMILMDLALGLRGSPLAVAGAANEWNAQWRDLGVLVFDGQNVMVAVTMDTVRRQMVTPRQGLAVKAFIELLPFLDMATPAFNAHNRCVMGKFAF